MQRIEQLPEAPERPADAHKGTFGSVLVIAGSLGMSGAAALTGRAALHGGAGLVRVAVPGSVLPTVAALHASYMTQPLEEDGEGRISAAAAAQLELAMQDQTVVALGPGLGQSAAVTTVVQRIYAVCSVALVLDADGLNAFAKESDSLKSRPRDAPRVLTPHPGEFARLTGLDVATIQADRQRLAAEFARRHDVVVLLKGAGTVITDGRRLAVNETGNSGLAKGGAGDVLTGLIAALLAQGMPAFDAAHLGAHLHGLAGDRAAEKMSEPYFSSMDLLDFLGIAWKEFLQARRG